MRVKSGGLVRNGRRGIRTEIGNSHPIPHGGREVKIEGERKPRTRKGTGLMHEV